MNEHANIDLSGHCVCWARKRESSKGEFTWVTATMLRDFYALSEFAEMQQHYQAMNFNDIFNPQIWPAVEVTPASRGVLKITHVTPPLWTWWSQPRSIHILCYVPTLRTTGWLLCLRDLIISNNSFYLFFYSLCKMRRRKLVWNFLIPTSYLSLNILYIYSIYHFK